MNSLFFIFAIFVFAITNTNALAPLNGINRVVSALSDYQIPEDGFTSDGISATLEDTSHAIFLSSFFGQRDKISVSGVADFLKRLNNEDNGYANRVGGKSELSALRNALLTLNHLGLPTANTELKNHIFDLYDSEKALFANSFGENPSIEATANALLCLEQLNGLNKVKSADIKNVLKTMKQDGNGVKYFSEDIVNNYYGIVVADLVGFEFGNVQPWAEFILSKQADVGEYEGAFVSRGGSSPKITESAVSAIAILDGYTDRSLIGDIDETDLFKYFSTLPRELDVAAHAFRAIARANLIDEILNTRVVYESLQDVYSSIRDRITQGLQIKPKLSVRTQTGLAHAGLDVSVQITSSAGDTKTIKLPWDDESQYYAGIEFYNAETLGTVSFKFVVKWVVAGIESGLEYYVVEEKTVGYKVKIESEAQLAGKNIEVGGDIGIGAEFNFKLSLGTIKNKNLLSGDFIVDFNVKDSSGDVFHSEPLDCRLNEKAIEFSYLLEKNDIPSGSVVFSFGVRGTNDDKYHTVKEVSYALVMKMIATDIQFPSETFQVGDTLTVSMSPASFPDLSTVIHFSNKDTQKRFFLDVLGSDDVVQSVQGVASVSGKSLVYTFKLRIRNTFDSLGKQTVAFRYQPEYGKDAYLENYDSEAGELFTELEELSYTVESKSNIVDVTGSINSGELRYGNSIKLGFKVQDSISGSYLYPISNEYTVFLRLKHKDENGVEFLGASEPASVIFRNNQPDHFAFDWNVSPNVVKGDAVLELVIQTPNGAVPLLSEDEEWTKQVTIGGDVVVETEVHSGEIDEKRTIFTLEFTLSCDNIKLNGADLVAVVTKDGKAVFESTVAYGVQVGDYSLSWVLDNKQTSSGAYKVDFFREVDRQRSANFDNIEPFFTTTIDHEKKVQERGIVPTQFLVLLVLIAAFGYVSYRKMGIEKASNRK